MLTWLLLSAIAGSLAATLMAISLIVAIRFGWLPETGNRFFDALLPHPTQYQEPPGTNVVALVGRGVVWDRGISSSISPVRLERPAVSFQMRLVRGEGASGILAFSQESKRTAEKVA